MKTKIIMLLFTALVTTTLSAQERIRSYYCVQVSSPNALPSVSENTSTYVEWYDNGTIKMLDGTVWRYQGKNNGVYVYAFQGGSVYMPGTRYLTACFSSDFSRLQVNFYFGMLGMEYPMSAMYSYLGEGRQPAYDWFNKKY